MQSVARMASALQSVFVCCANSVAKTCGVIQRERTFTGASLCQTFVFGWLANPQATVEELSHQAAASGAGVSAQAVHQRFTDRLPEFFRILLEEASTQMITAMPKAIELVQRFTGVWLCDSTVINLPTQFAKQWPACAGNPGQSEAALKVQFLFDYVRGGFRTLLEAGRSPDVATPLQQANLPPNSLRLADLGYFDVSVLADYVRNGVEFITRIQPRTAVFTPQGERLKKLCSWLKKQRTNVVDVSAQLGNKERLPCRLIAVRASSSVISRRRKRLKKDAKRRGRPVSSLQWQWVGWTVFATSLSSERATWQEICVLYRLRWQIEMLFKLWKSHGELECSRSNLPQRQMAEVFAKLLGMIVKHWLLLTSVWHLPNVSLTKAARLWQRYIPTISIVLDDRSTLMKLLHRIREPITHGCRMNRRRKKPNTYQFLIEPDLLDWGLT